MMRYRLPKLLYITILTAFALLFTNSCGLGEEEVFSTTYNEKFRISISCDSDFLSTSQYLNVAVGEREIFRSYTASFDTPLDCARAVEKLTVIDGSVIELTYYDGPRHFSVDIMREF